MLQAPDTVIRDAQLADLDTIVEFNLRLARESEQRELDRSLLVPGVRRILEDSSHGCYHLAQRGSEIAGQLMITREWSDWRCGEFWWIQSVYVAPEHRRQGVFSALYRHVLEQARARTDICGIRLYVEDENTRAQTTYRAAGMHPTGYRVMEVDFRSAAKAPP